MKLVLFFSGLFAALAWLLPNHYQPWLDAYQNACAFLSLPLFLVLSKQLRLMRFETAEAGTLRAEKITLDLYILDQLREYTRLARTQPQNIMGEKKLTWAKQVAHHHPFGSR